MAGTSMVFCDAPANLARALESWMPRPTAVVGIGNPLCGDDGFGPAVVARLRPASGLHLFDVQAVPESFLVPIVESGCSGVLLVDAADLGVEPGRAALVSADRLSEVDVSTHAIALVVVAEAVRRLAREARGSDLVCALLASQPESLAEADRLSLPVQRAVRLAVEGIRLFSRAAGQPQP